MTNFQGKGTIHPDPAEPPIAKIVGINRTGPSPSLELRVKIRDQDHDALLLLDALEDYGLSGPAAVEELRAIRVALVDLVQAVKDSPGR